MVSKFSAFLSQNVERIPNVKFVVSNRFKDENGKPIEWELRAVSSAENDELQRKAIVNVPVVGQRGQYNRELDQIKYVGLLLTASVVYPDLNDAELQDSYGVKTPHELLKSMLYAKEEENLAKKVMEISNVEDLEVLVKEAKN